jgi:hypothetical protein
MVVWRGYGIAVALLAFAALLLAEVTVEAVFGDQTYYQAHGWPKLLALVVAAGAVWVLSRRLESRDRVVVDKATGQELTLRDRHDLFFVPLRYWPGILVAFGIGVAIFG